MFHKKEVYFTAWPFSKLQVLHWPIARAAFIFFLKKHYDTSEPNCPL